MKLGEALAERKRLQELIPGISKALQTNITVEEGQLRNAAQIPAATLKEQLVQALSDLASLIININHTNNVTGTETFGTVMQAIGLREALKLKIATYSSVLSAIRPRRERGYDKEITIYIVAEGIHPVGIRQEFDRAAETLRKLTAELQTVNWTVELQKL